MLFKDFVGRIFDVWSWIVCVYLAIAILLVIGYGIWWVCNLMLDLRKHIDKPVDTPKVDWREQLIKKHNIYQYSLEEIKVKLKKMGVMVLNETGIKKWGSCRVSGFVSTRKTEYGTFMSSGYPDCSLWQSYALCLSNYMDNDELNRFKIREAK